MHGRTSDVDSRSSTPSSPASSGDRATQVVVVGGGIAGISAATTLAERGIAVTLFEAERFLGGRAGAWPDQLADGTSFHMERGFHAFFRQYYVLRDLLRRVDPELSLLKPMTDYPLLGPDGSRESFADLPRRAPWNVMELVRRTPSLRWWDLPRVSVPRAAAMLAFDPERTYARWDRVSARAYLDALHFPEKARRMLFDVFAHSFFNPEDDYSAAELLAMFHFYFVGNPEGLVFDVMRRPFSVLFERLGQHLQTLGVEVRLGCAVERIKRMATGFRVEAQEHAVECSHIVLALSVPGLKALARASPHAFDPTLGAQIDALDVTLPFVVWRLFLDGDLDADRAPFAGTTGVGILDNVSLYARIEDESRAWAERTGGSVVELHAYAVDPTWNERRIRDELLAGLHAVYPETRRARVIEDRYLFRRDCPAFRPGSHARRPTVRTSTRNLFLAGDFVRLPFASALMERAAITGLLAGNAVLEHFGFDVRAPRTTPVRGLLASAPGL